MQSLVKLFNRRTGAKTAVVLLTITILIIAFASMTTSAPEVTYGDVNQDGSIDVRDVVLVMQYIVGLRDLTEDQFKAADVNGDGDVNVQDATMIMRHILNIETLSKAIKEVEEVTINVFVNNPADRLYFPSKVKATLADDTVKELSVEWEETSTPPYVKEEAGEYVFEGELVNLPWGISNPDGIKARAVVNVLLYDTPRLPTPVPGFDLFALTLMVEPPEAGFAAGSGDYEAGEEVQITVFDLNPDYEFVNWTWDGVEVSTSQTFEFTMPAENIILVANFVPVDDPVVPDSFEDLGGQVEEVVPGVFNVFISFDDAQARFPGITTDSIIVLSISGKDPIELEYDAITDEFIKFGVQGYTEDELNGASVSVLGEVEPITADDLNVIIVEDYVPGYSIVSIEGDEARDNLTGVTGDSELVLDVAGKDPIILEYDDDLDEYINLTVSGYTETEIRNAIVTVQ